MLETWNLVRTLRGSILAFFVKRIFWFDLNLYLYLMVWLEIGCLTKTCDRDSKLATHLGGAHTSIFEETFFWFDFNLYLYLMVWLEIGHLHTVKPYLHWGLYYLFSEGEYSQSRSENEWTFREVAFFTWLVLIKTTSCV